MVNNNQIEVNDMDDARIISTVKTTMLNNLNKFEPFITRIVKDVPQFAEVDEPGSVIVEAFYNQLIIKESGEEIRTAEDQKDMFSLIIWTELNDGADDYTAEEIDFLLTMTHAIKDEQPWIMKHQNTRLLMPSNN